MNSNGESMDMNSNLTAVIMAGGAGTRFWPVSTAQKPKQFLNLLGGRTLIQQSFDRLKGLVAPERIFVFTNERFVPYIVESTYGLDRTVLALLCQAYDEELVEYILGLMQKYGLEPWMLELEITESAYTDNMHLLVDTVARFRKEGFKILLDNFGSGYSSLNMLRNMPVDVLKLDVRSRNDIQHDSRARAIVKNVAQLARDLAMDVVVEGVETKEQLDFLTGVGCKNIQGFYVSRPLTKEDYLGRLSGSAAPGQA